MVARPWSSSRVSCGEHLSVEMRQEHREVFPDQAGKGSLISSYEAETGLLWMWAGPSCFLSSGMGMSGNFLSYSKCVKVHLEVPEVSCDLPREASAEMGLISPGGQNLLGFLELWQVHSSYDGDLRDPLWWPQDWPVPIRVARGPLGIPLPSMPWPKTLCGVGAGTRGFLSSADMDLGVLLESPQGSQSSFREGACTCAFLSRCSGSVTLPVSSIMGSVVFPRVFPTRLSQGAFPQGCPSCRRGVS